MKSQLFYNKIFSILFFISTSAYIILAKTNTRTGELQKISETDDSLYVQEILRAAKAAEIQSYLNKDIEPCENFYEFACSKFSKFHPAKRGISSNMLQIMSDALRNKIEKFLNAPEVPADMTIDRKVKRFYESCTRIKDLTTYRSKLMMLISEFGKMPVLSGNRNWNEEKFDWIAMIAKMQRRYGKPALLQLDVAPDFRDSSVNCLYIGQPKMLLNNKAMYNDNSTALYRDLVMLSISEQLETFLNVPKRLARTTAFEIMSFEIMLSRGMWEGKMENDKINVLTTIGDWKSKYGLVIDVERFIHLTLGRVSTECFYESVESFQANLRNLLPQVSKHVVANYLFYMLLNNDFFLRIERSASRQKALCQSKVTSYFNKVLDNMIYRQYNNKKSENDLKLIYEQLKTSLKRTFISNELGWMNAKARFNAIEKLDKMHLEINSHENDNSTAEFDELSITTNYFDNVKNLLLIKGKQFVESIYELPKPIDAPALLSFSPANLIHENKIKFPVATLQPYFLWANAYPNSIKFGNLGTTLAHELIHGFDDEGRKFDKNGNQYNWWDIDSIQAFNERKKCFVEQYSKYKFGDNYLNGEMVLSENIADNGGLKLAYNAYMLWYNDSNRLAYEIKRETLSPLNYTNIQLFFISFAQLWCTDTSENIKNLQTATDTHSPNIYRIIGSVSNSPEFSEAFNCHIGQAMNPETKCKIY